jgi:hypothetical protein
MERVEDVFGKIAFSGATLTRTLKKSFIEVILEEAELFEKRLSRGSLFIKVHMPLPEGGVGYLAKGSITLSEKNYEVELKLEQALIDRDEYEILMKLSEAAREHLGFGGIFQDNESGMYYKPIKILNIFPVK